MFVNDYLKYTLDVILGFLTDISCTYICTRMYTCMYKYKNTAMFQNMCEFLSFENFAGRKYRLTSHPCNIKMEVDSENVKLCNCHKSLQEFHHLFSKKKA